MTYQRQPRLLNDLFGQRPGGDMERGQAHDGLVAPGHNLAKRGLFPRRQGVDQLLAIHGVIRPVFLMSVRSSCASMTPPDGGD
jgi:hypothetical protein